jgi:hypothetical protein
VLIRIARAVRLTLLGSEIQALNPGEIYEVAPSVGRVLVTDGWAMEVCRERRVLWDDVASAGDAASGNASRS